jgi:ABC-type lipoprotein release transport system permease subunit
VLASVIQEGVVVALAGLATGFGASLALLEVLRSVTGGIEPLDPSSYVAVALVLTLSTAAACWVPTCRAMRLDPATTLRQG